ncbi:hypothetical protein K466DRAFT_442540, partial [Polyporus arcularius HHB13444]
LMRSHGVIISGSAALRFFLPGETWQSTDLDLYVPDDAFDAFRLAFESRFVQGSRLLFDSAEFREPVEPDAYSVKQLLRYSLPSGRVIDVIRSHTRAASAPLLGFWSTLLVNYISPDVFACGYPEYTLERLAVLK